MVRAGAAKLLAAMALLGVIVLARPAAADEQADFEKARNAYLARQFDEADNRFRVLLDKRSPTRLSDGNLVGQARMFYGATLFALGKSKEAEEQFEVLLDYEPMYEPDPLSFPTQVVNLFIDVRARIRERLRRNAEANAKREAERRAQEEAERLRQQTRVELLEKLASEETLVHRNSRWVALLPFGVGQFQNGERALGWFFLGAEGVLVATTLISAPVYLAQSSSAAEARSRRDSFREQQYLERADDARVVNLVANGALYLTALAGIVQAQVAFVQETREIRPRRITTANGPVFRPFAAPTPAAGSEGAPTGLVVGASGRF